MYRNLHITIFEGGRRRVRRARTSPSGHSGRGESDPTTPEEAMGDPDDPTTPEEAMGDPDDPTGRGYAVVYPGAPGYAYGAAATVSESAGPAAAAHCCRCCPADEAKAAPRPGATLGDRSGFVIVRLAAGIDPKTAGSLWDLARTLPLPALEAALEMAVEEAEGGEEGEGGDGRAQTAGTVEPAGLGVRRHHDKGEKDKEKGGGHEGGGEKGDGKKGSGGGGEPPQEPPRPSEPPGVLRSRPLVTLDREQVGFPIDRAHEIGLIRKLEAAAALTSFKPLHSLAAYWRVDVRPYSDRIDEVVERFNRLAEVDLAYAELTAYDPAEAYGDSFGEDQGYLAEAPVGIGARWAWEALGDLVGPPKGDDAAERVKVADLEQRWYVDHREFGNDVANKTFIVGGHNRADKVTDFGHHGTAVVGQLAATGAPGGVSGAATGVGRFILASHYWGKDKKDADGERHLFADTAGHVASAIVNLLSETWGIYRLGSGDVLLLEVQRGRLPAEVDAADFDAIRLAAALGVIVVEAGGNGGVDLDRYVDPDTGRGLDRAGRRFRDSGAILVGAARSAPPHERASFSNYGSRIDCFAWGDSVTSCGYGDLSDRGADPDSYYTNSFSGTSSAAPIIAGAAALVQALHEAVGGTRLLPRAMRSALSDRRSGTPQGRGVAGHIGVMPDLCALVRDRLQLVPDVYMRARVGDDGRRPLRGGEISSSPDILAWTGEVAASDRFGEGLTANSPAPGRPFAWDDPAAHPTDVYVRLRNRGRGGGEVPVRLYASRAATLITPERWHPIGDLQVKGVPQGDTLTVGGPVKDWDPNDLGASPSNAPWSDPDKIVPPVSFLAVHGPDAVLPPGPPYFDWAEYREFLRGPGVAWRNVHKVQIADAPGGTVELAFFIAGTPDRGRDFDFEVLQRLPAGVEVKLVSPGALAAKLRQRLHFVTDGGAGIPLPARSRTSLGRVHLSAGCRAPAAFRLRVDDPGKLSRTGHSLAIRQLWRGEEVGRITWWFLAKPKTGSSGGGGVGRDDRPIDPHDDMV